MADRMADRLRAYRGCVLRLAAGEPIPADDARDLRRTMAALGLPAMALPRDVRAWRPAGGASEYRRVELAVLYPHLFDDVERWVRERAGAIGRVSVFTFAIRLAKSAATRAKRAAAVAEHLDDVPGSW